jgi:hypothetical protein
MVDQAQTLHGWTQSVYDFGGPMGVVPTFQDTIPFLPAVLTKVADNLECYVRMLESDGDLQGEFR